MRLSSRTHRPIDIIIAGTHFCTLNRIVRSQIPKKKENASPISHGQLCRTFGYQSAMCPMYVHEGFCRDSMPASSAHAPAFRSPSIAYIRRWWPFNAVLACCRCCCCRYCCYACTTQKGLYHTAHSSHQFIHHAECFMSHRVYYYYTIYGRTSLRYYSIHTYMYIESCARNTYT